VRTLKELNERLEHLRRNDVQGIELWTHASMLSVYYRDPENNRMEFFMETPYYVRQPIAETLDVDISQDEATVWKAIEDRYGADPSFQLMADWKKAAVRKREESQA
jgi:catechol 2,3-dioxygenase